MMKFRSAAIVAASLYLVIGTAAYAGGVGLSAIAANPDPSVQGQPVNVSATLNDPGNRACNGSIRFEADGDPGTPFSGTTLCTVALPGTATPVSVSCTAPTGFPVAGNNRFLLAFYTPGGVCESASNSTQVDVEAAPVSAVPTVGEWTMWGLAGLIALGGGVALSRRSRRLV